MQTLYFAYLMAYALNGDQFSAAGKDNPAAKGVETRTLEALGPQGATLEECVKFANDQRKRAAITYKLIDYRQIAYDCRPLVLSNK